MSCTMSDTMNCRTLAAPTRRRSVAARCALVLCAVVAPLACSSTRGARTEPSTTTTTSSTTTSSTSTTTSTTLAPTTTQTPLVTAGATVMVANSSKKGGAARTLTDELAATGFTLAHPTDGFGPDAGLDESKIYVIAGSEDVAESVSRAMGGVKMLPMPTPVWITGGTAALGDVTVVVMLGNDLAGMHLGAMGNR